MAEVYDVDFDLLVWEFASEKYDLQESPWFISAPKRFPTFAGVSGLPVICKAFRTSGVLPMLDLDGILQWQLQFPNLQRLWFWSLRFGNRAYDAAVNATQKELLKRGIKITFFIDGEDATSGGDFWMWQNAMSHDAEVGELFRKQVAVIPAPREAVIWNSGEAILANGHDFTLKPNGILVVSGECGLELGQEKLTASMRMMMTCANDQDKVGSMFV
jgi:hypothetical protein